MEHRRGHDARARGAHASGRAHVRVHEWGLVRGSLPDRCVLDGEDVIGFQQLVRRVPVAENVVRYAVALAHRSRPTSPDAPDYIRRWVRWGAGPRASQFLILGAKTRVILQGRPSPDIGDVKVIAAPVLRHRLDRQFVLGASIHDALRHADESRGHYPGFPFSFDMLGEGARTDAAAHVYLKHYCEALEVLTGRGHGAFAPEARDGISVKLSALFPRYEELQSARVMGVEGEFRALLQR